VISVSNRFLGVSSAVLVAAWQVSAFAQAVLAEEPPKSFAEGFMQGVGLPVISLYHLAAMIGIGILVGIAARGIVPILAFGLAAIAGVAIQLSPYDIPADGLFVALTTMVIGVLILLRLPLSPLVASIVFAVAGLVHGYSLGSVLVGADTVGIVAYVSGLLVAQTGLGVASCAITLGATKWPAQRTALMIAGCLVMVAGGVAAIEAAGLIG
jgi:urease accessory protein